MTQQIEAMKRWLDALEKERDNYFHGDTDGAPEYLYEAIASLRQAIEQEQKQEPVAAERESVAVWLEKECDEQYLADRVRAGDHTKEKGHTASSQCALVTDDVGVHQPPHIRKELDGSEYTSLRSKTNEY